MKSLRRGQEHTTLDVPMLSFCVQVLQQSSVMIQFKCLGHVKLEQDTHYV